MILTKRNSALLQRFEREREAIEEEKTKKVIAFSIFESNEGFLERTWLGRIKPVAPTRWFQ